MSDEVNNMMVNHTNAVIQLTLANVESMVYMLKGTEEPGGPYSRGYRDGLDMVLMQIRKLKAVTNDGQPTN